jgi:hypothetical protein
MRIPDGAALIRVPGKACLTHAAVHLGGLARTSTTGPLLSRNRIALRLGEVLMLALERRPVNDRHGFLRPCWIPLLLLFFAFHLASSQSGTGGSVAGQVSDSGGRLSPALVTLRNTATGSQRQTLCDMRPFTAGSPQPAPPPLSAAITSARSIPVHHPSPMFFRPGLN